MQLIIVACALLGVALGQTTVSPGFTGFPGFTGYQGYKGYPGYQGYSGYPGYQGYNGYSGYQGYSGYPGYQGYSGYPGYQGYNGYQGYPGYKFPGTTPKPLIIAKPTEDGKKDLPAPVVPVITQSAGPYAAIRSQQQDSAPDGSYSYSYDTENGIYAAESGSTKVGPNGPEQVVVGQYAYTGPDNQQIIVRYTADANGFHPEGSHLPGNYAGYTGQWAGRAFPDVIPVPKPVVAAKPAVTVEKKEE